MLQSLAGIRRSAIAKILLLVALLVMLNIAAREAVGLLDLTIRPRTEDMVHRTIMISALLYVVLLAIPFVPGAEIGLALMAMLGPQIAPLVYLCTLAGLALGFLIGRLVPLSMLARLAHDCRLERAARLLAEIEPLDQDQRLALLIERAPRRLLPLVLRHRHLALALALNIPGNYLIGGGGGIALVAGISRLYSVPGFLLIIALAVAPVPLAVLVFGSGFLPH
ncbi:hypothetical protein [Piscinibacter sakaiensis]|uniref:hypothetical protein n=1 Tax=Piscinibacter sakaiensis TaxID=1547922 RepID=UPI003AAEE67E